MAWQALAPTWSAVPHADAMLVKLPRPTWTHWPPPARATTSLTAGAPSARNWPDPDARCSWSGGDAGPDSIGLYATGLTVTLGAARVTYRDQAPRRLAIAAALGTYVIDSAPPRKAAAFPITVDSSGTPEGLRCALDSTAFDGTCTTPSIYLKDPALPLFLMYSRCCTLIRLCGFVIHCRLSSTGNLCFRHPGPCSVPSPTSAESDIALRSARS
jgi:hypothetical protein